MSQMMLEAFAKMVGIKPEDIVKAISGTVEAVQDFDTRLTRMEETLSKLHDLVNSMATGIYVLPDASSTILAQEHCRIEDIQHVETRTDN